MMPTLLAISETTLPKEYEGREPQPLAGASLLPIFAGDLPESRPPLHFLFAKDRGFREGDWKIVSRREGPWELYNIAKDRTERKNLAAEHPEIVERLTKQWHQMTAEVLQGTKSQQSPVSKKNSPHPEWSDYSGKNGTNTSRRRAQK